MRPALFALTLTLAACGADGPPVAPTREAPPESGIRLSGDARVGLTFGGP